MADDHAIQRLLCDDLERVADQLPALPALRDLRRISDRIMRITRSHFPRAETVLRGLPAERRPPLEALATLHEMHVLDEMHGQDLVVALWEHAGAPGGGNVGQLSYMLRGFFDGCRRAISLKESYLAFAANDAVRRG